MKVKFCVCTVCLILASLSLFAQNDTTVLSRAINSLKNNSAANPVEKVYLQLDKPYYAAGEDIWFKTYVTAGSKHILSGISGVVTVELVNPKSLVQQYVKLPLAGGLTWGDFKISDTIKAGNYHIRAYTNWMRNAGSEYFYDQLIKIGNAILPALTINNTRKPVKPAAKQLATMLPQSAKTDVQFLPESGNLVYGINSKVAFKAVGEDGLGKEISGIITDDQNQEVARFSSRHLGMGVFNLLPINGRIYKALVAYADGSEKSIELPKPLLKGYVLSVDNTDPLYLEVKVAGSPGFAGETGISEISLVAQSGGEVYYAAKSKSSKSAFSSIIPKSKFPSGIVQFTLFSPGGEPLNERLVFIKNHDELNLSVAAPVDGVAARQKIKINLTAKNSEGKPALGNFSVAVTDETKVPEDEADASTIFSSLLLTSDIKGFVEKPNYYFTANEQANEDLDVLMLTQGYHRFVWKQILTGNFTSVVYQPENSLQIAGYLKTPGGKPIAKGKISVLSSSNGFFMEDTVSDDKGYFAFKNLQFADSTKFVVQSKKKNVELELDSGGVAPITQKYRIAEERGNKDTILSAYLANSKKTYDEQVKYGIGNHIKQLKEVTIKAEKPLPNSSNLNGPGNADQVLLTKDLSGACMNIATCLMGKLRSVFFLWDDDKMVYFPAMFGNDGMPHAMLIKVDGITMSAETLNTLPPEIVESVEVLKSVGFSSVYGSEGHNGLILINTKKGNYWEASSNRNIISYSPKGYYKAREFYSPQYDYPKTNKQIADLRTTIYWNPNIATDKDGLAAFEYFNADSKGTYRIIIEGIDGNGNIGRQVCRYKVE